MELFQNQKRTPTLTDFEKELLINLVHQNQLIVENKKTDVVSSQQKNRGWQRISEIFNSSPNTTKRGADQLKNAGAI